MSFQQGQPKVRLATIQTSILSLLTCAFISGCSEPESSLEKSSGQAANVFVAEAEIANPSDFIRDDEAVYFSFHDLGLSKPQSLLVESVQGSQNEALASQPVDRDFDGFNDGILFVTTLQPNEVQQIRISQVDETSTSFKQRTHAEISHKVGGQWQPHTKYPDSIFKEYVGGEFTPVETLSPPPHYTDHSNWIRYEGPGIESDKVGYRVYLDWRNGFDIFGKKRSEPILQEVGQDGYSSYHEMQPWGMDILKVGNSLGAGGFGSWQQGAVKRVSDVEQWQASVVASGPIHSGFTIEYSGWKSESGSQDLSAHLGMNAGSRLAEVVLDFDENPGQMAVGIVKHENTELIVGKTEVTGKAYTYIASWGKQALDGSFLGMAVFFQKEHLDSLTDDKNNYLAILNPKGNPSGKNQAAHELNYHFAAVWQLESGIDSKAAFIDYLEQQTERLTVKPRVRLKTQRSLADKQVALTAESALEWSNRLANSELLRKADTYRYDGWDVHRQRLPKFEYDIVGLYPHTLLRLSEKTGNPSQAALIEQVTGSFVEDDGGIRRYKFEDFNIDSVAPGSAVLALYRLTGEEKYRKAAELLRRQLHEHPKTSEGAFWHKKKYPHQLWLDGVYMGMPFLAEYQNMFENSEGLEEVVKEFELTRQYLRNPENGLYYHAWDESKRQGWADNETGLSPEFWARGMGWLAMAVVDALALIPEQKQDLRAPLIDMSKEMAAALIASQDPETGTWWQVLDKPDMTGNYRESSATAMFVYFLATALDKGYIDEGYKDETIRAFNGMINEFVLVHADGTISMTNQCYVAGLGFGRDGSYQYYMSEPVWQNDPKGNVPFILAGMAMHDLLSED